MIKIDSKIAVLGYGSEGEAIAAFLKQQKYKNITICDEKKDLSELKGRFSVKTGASAFDNLNEFDYVFRSPGIHKDHPEIIKARKKGTVITSGTILFFDLCPCKIIGITGTKGKGTTSTLIYNILKEAGYDVYLGGNIGNPPFEFLDTLKKDSVVVLELSSFQLHDLHKSPNISVILNTTSEHLDYHKDVEEYLSAKESIVRYQKKNDMTIANVDYPYHTRFMALTKGKRFYVSKDRKIDNGAFLDKHKILVSIDNAVQEVCLLNDIGLIGPHNIENVLPAVTVAAYLGIQADVIRKAVKDFKGLPHRLEFIRNVEGTDYFNDSFSTTPDTCIAAINSFEKPAILIAGGSEKNSDFTLLGKAIVKKANLETVVLMGETADRIEEAILKANKDEVRFVRTTSTKGKKSKNPDIVLDIVRTTDYKEAFFAAKIHAKKGGVVLLSPACASFDMFKNYKVRGDTFRKWVESL